MQHINNQSQGWQQQLLDRPHMCHTSRDGSIPNRAPKLLFPCSNLRPPTAPLLFPPAMLQPTFLPRELHHAVISLCVRLKPYLTRYPKVLTWCPLDTSSYKRIRLYSRAMGYVYWFSCRKVVFFHE